MGDLPDFEGLPVKGVRLEIRNIAGGLVDAMDVNPIVLHQGDEFDVTVRCKLRSIRHDPEDKDVPDGPQWRVQIASATRAVIVDPSVAEKDFAAQAELLAQRDQIKGQQKAGLTPPWLGYEDLTADEVVTRIEELADDEDLDTIDRAAQWEEANGGRGKVLEACAAAQKVIEGRS